MLDDVAKAAAAFESKRTRVLQAVELARGIAERAAPGSMTPIYVALEDFASKFQRAAGAPPDDDANGQSRLAWNELVTNLRESASVTLGA
jgi:hypothetical protein